MGERTEHPHGTHSWVDLSTDDADAAKEFYAGLFGWDFRDEEAGEDMTYSMAQVQGKDVAALFKGDGSLPVHWNCYVTVDDVDAMPDKVKEAGGEVMAEPFDVMEAGRMMVLQDPTGAFLNLWQAKDSIGAHLVNVPGALTWNDLNTSDPEAAIDFYGKLFGWESQPLADDYWGFKNGDRNAGGLRRLADDRIPSHWLAYFACDDAAAGAKRVEELGGRIFYGPEDVPGGAYVIVQDPQGGIFGLAAGEFDD
jgi:hypothetical protein